MPSSALELAWERVRWEVLTNPFEVPDPFFQLNLRRPELTGEPPALELDGYRPEPALDLTLVRGARLRRKRALSLRDYLLLVAAVTSRQPELEERLQPLTDTFQLAPGVAWLQPPSPGRQRALLRAHRWWLHADVSNCFESMDYRRLVGELGLDRPWSRAVLRLLQEHRAGPRQGVMSVGRVNHILTRLYLQPVVAGLAGYTFQLTGLDDFHLYVDSRNEGLRALERLTALLAGVGLQVNFSRTWLVEGRRALREQALAPLRAAHLRHRLAAWGARLGLPVAGWFALEDGVFIHRRPDFRELLRWPAVQEAFRRRLERDDPYPGDRALLLLGLAWSPHRPEGGLREYLVRQEGALYRMALTGCAPIPNPPSPVWNHPVSG